MKIKKENKEISLTVRLSIDDWERLEWMTNKWKTNKSLLIRTLILKEYEKQTD